MAKLSSLSDSMKGDLHACPRCGDAYFREGLKCPKCGGALQKVKQLEMEGTNVDNYEVIQR
ncbi:hypothetical protein FACS1894200_00320 [Spirochaetia bacterium]|nr:hypothetical protein FACS1894200_00320 [Spirochaetia bacterium]